MSKSYYTAEYVGKDKNVKFSKRGDGRGDIVIRRHFFKRKFSVTPCHGMRFKEYTDERMYYDSFPAMLSDWNLVGPVDPEEFRRDNKS